MVPSFWPPVLMRVRVKGPQGLLHIPG
jgi:hypothetical protein